MNPQLTQCKFSVFLLSLLDLSATATLPGFVLFHLSDRNCIDSNGEKLNLRGLGFIANIVQYLCK